MIRLFAGHATRMRPGCVAYALRLPQTNPNQSKPKLRLTRFDNQEHSQRMAKLGYIKVVTSFAECCKCIEQVIDKAPASEFTVEDAVRLETAALLVRDKIVKAATGQPSGSTQ